MARRFWFACLLFLVSPLFASSPFPAIKAIPAFPKLSFEQPVYLTFAPDQSHRLFVVEQAGRVMAFSNQASAATASPFLDIRSKVRLGEEEGLLCLAFHPHFAQNRFFYVIYSLKDANPRRTILARFMAPAAGNGPVDPAGEEILFQVEKPYSNHNGSTLAFGPDGRLYISLGDGGSGGDPHGNAQNPDSFLGKILRLDVDHAGSRPEIWALGLRNPWRMSFDTKTGELWAGDVGQNKWEEIDLIRQGGNYGWNIREGSHAFKGPEKQGLIEPVLDYGRREGFSVTGGYVYRGKAIPRLRGTYVFADFGSRKVWGLKTPPSRPAHWARLFKSPESVASFGTDENQEIYIVGYEGHLFRLAPARP